LKNPQMKCLKMPWPHINCKILCFCVINLQLDQLHPLSGKRFAEEMECHWGCSIDILRSVEFLTLSFKKMFCCFLIFFFFCFVIFFNDNCCKKNCQVKWKNCKYCGLMPGSGYLLQTFIYFHFMLCLLEMFICPYIERGLLISFKNVYPLIKWLFPTRTDSFLFKKLLNILSITSSDITGCQFAIIFSGFHVKMFSSFFLTAVIISHFRNNCESAKLL